MKDSLFAAHRAHIDDLPRSTFAREFEGNGGRPVIIEGATEKWAAKEKWSLEFFAQKFGSRCWRLSDTHGECLTLDEWYKYLGDSSDDSPLGIYDSQFGEVGETTSGLLEDFSIPSCFSADVFEAADSVPLQGTATPSSGPGSSSSSSNSSSGGDSSSSGGGSSGVTRSGEVDEEEKGEGEEDEVEWVDRDGRPPYRWILMGAARSGTGMHVDPLWTHGWLTVLEGRKKWVIFPPHVDPAAIGLNAEEDTPSTSSVQWFLDYYSRVTSPDWTGPAPVEALQGPGDTIFVPQGWPHVVLNLDPTLALTFNYASLAGDSDKLVEVTVAEEPLFARRWLRDLALHVQR